MDLLLQVMRAVSYWHTATAIKMASRVGALFHHCFVQCCPSTSSCQGNTERVVAFWRHAEASGVAVDMLHWAMPSVLHRCTMSCFTGISRAALLPLSTASPLTPPPVPLIQRYCRASLEDATSLCATKNILPRWKYSSLSFRRDLFRY